MVFQKGNKMGKQFSKDYQPSPKAKSEGRKEKYAYRDACKITLDNKQEFMLADLVEAYQNASPEQKVSILNHLATFSGQKPADKQEFSGGNIEININRKPMEEN